MFKCNQCGQCCRNLNKSHIYDSLHNGNGICKYLDGNRCSIYYKRPIACRVDESYNFFFKDKISYNEYIQLNYKSCELLNKEGK